MPSLLVSLMAMIPRSVNGTKEVFNAAAVAADSPLIFFGLQHIVPPHIGFRF